MQKWNGFKSISVALKESSSLFTLLNVVTSVFHIMIGFVHLQVEKLILINMKFSQNDKWGLNKDSDVL